MENEEIVESTPTETMESDDDFFSEIDDEVMSETNEEEYQESVEEDENQIPTETQEDTSNTEEVDLQPLLKALSGKIKYNKEEVNVESIDDLIENYQKGLNYDKKLQELENLQNSKLEQYAKAKADELGISVDEYMDRVEKYEEDRQREQEQDELNQLVDAGMPEALAKELIAGRQQRKELQKELNEIKADKLKAEEENKKNREYQEFLEKFPDVKPDSIPKEVFERAEQTSLSNAYMEWKIKDLETKLSIKETNEKNSTKTVGSVTSTGPTNEKHEIDFFLEGFNE